MSSEMIKSLLVHSIFQRTTTQSKPFCLKFQMITPEAVAAYPIPTSFILDAEQNYCGKPGVHNGWQGLADKYGCALILPSGHSRATGPTTCLGFEGQISDIPQMISELEKWGARIDRSRIYTCGVSMGGQEALLIAAKYPDWIAAVFVFNPVVDVKAFYEDVCRYEYSGIHVKRGYETMETEIGGNPDMVPDEYRKRSPVAYANVSASNQIPTNCRV